MDLNTDHLSIKNKGNGSSMAGYFEKLLKVLWNIDIFPLFDSLSKD